MIVESAPSPPTSVATSSSCSPPTRSLKPATYLHAGTTTSGQVHAGARCILHRIAQAIAQAHRVPRLLAGDHGGASAAPLRQSRSTASIAGCVDATQVRGVAYQWRQEGKSWKLPLLGRVAAGAFAAKPSTPYGTGTLHDFMHAKLTVVDDTVFVGSFNLSRSGERNAENVLEIDDAAIADRLAGYVDELRARYPALSF